MQHFAACGRKKMQTFSGKKEIKNNQKKYSNAGHAIWQFGNFARLLLPETTPFVHG